MIVLNHGASFAVAEDVALVRERVHPATMAAEGPLHELGAIAHRQLRLAGHGPDDGDGPADVPARPRHARWRATEAGTGIRAAGRSATTTTERVLRYLAKVTIEPAITHGIADHVGSLQPGRLADIVLWKPAYFGVKPELVLKGGLSPAWAPLGEGNATVERAEPTRYRPDWGGLGRAAASLSVTFVSSRAVGSPALRRHGRALHRGQGHARPDPRHRSPGTGHRRRSRSTFATARSPLDGRPLAVEPVAEVPLSRRYLLR